MVDAVGRVKVEPRGLAGGDVSHTYRSLAVMKHLELVIVGVAEELSADDVFVSVRYERKEWRTHTSNQEESLTEVIQAERTLSTRAHKFGDGFTLLETNDSTFNIHLTTILLYSRDQVRSATRIPGGTWPRRCTSSPAASALFSSPSSHANSEAGSLEFATSHLKQPWCREERKNETSSVDESGTEV
ncbi:hypothetical protein E2C01_007897 [Portunus trituberculatus]|uniref:Uncharacterized protein n=1 Tax=Portunus trituberculatus TaxID=210409 RepID=A0A5B7D1C1_PORTR|nr:hypothetical protein [Portunus trituberculatus]